MDLSDIGNGASGWLASLLGNSSSPGQPTSLAAPGVPAPTPDSAGMPVNGTAPTPAGGPTISGALTALGGAGPGVQKAVTRPSPPAPQITFPQARGNPTAAALAQVMAKLKQPSM
jgi:hypothetical protein